MDFDDDGILDMVSGSYDPGDVYLFRGLGEGKYAARELLRDEDGVPLVHHPKELAKFHKMEKDPNADDDESIQARIASFGSWAAPVDWDGDEDLDMLIGSFSGFLFLRENIGTRAAPVFSAVSTQVKTADGKVLQVNAHANPVVADWNEDGLWDLVVGASDGSVQWFPNGGTFQEPSLGKPKVLVEAKSEHKFMEQDVSDGQTPKPGVRAQICVVDYDLDGRLDLLLGDYSTHAGKDHNTAPMSFVWLYRRLPHATAGGR